MKSLEPALISRKVRHMIVLTVITLINYIDHHSGEPERIIIVFSALDLCSYSRLKTFALMWVIYNLRTEVRFQV